VAADKDARVVRKGPEVGSATVAALDNSVGSTTENQAWEDERRSFVVEGRSRAAAQSVPRVSGCPRLPDMEGEVDIEVRSADSVGLARKAAVLGALGDRTGQDLTTAAESEEVVGMTAVVAGQEALRHSTLRQP